MLKQSPAQRLGRAGSTLMFVCLFVFTLLILVQLARTLVIVSVDVEASAAGTMAIQWRDNASDYSEFKSKKTSIRRGRQVCFLLFWTSADVDKIRLQPLDTPADIIIHNVIIRTLGYDRLVYDTDKHFQNFRPLAQLSNVHVENNQLSMRTLGSLAQFEFDSIHTQINTKNAALIAGLNLKLGLIVLALLLILSFTYPLAQLALFIISILISLVCFSPFRSNYAVINIDMQSVSNQLVVYWAAEHLPYTEQQSNRLDTDDGRHAYLLGMGDLNALQHIRIDPLAAKGTVLIKQIEISAFGYDPIVINAKNKFYALDFSKNKNIRIVGDALEFIADTDDAFFELQFDAYAFKTTSTLSSYLVFLILLLLINVGGSCLKIRYPASSGMITAISLKIGGIILAIMLLQLFFSAEYGFYIDYQANELVITTAGERAQHVNAVNSNNNLLHIGLLNLAYGVVIVSALLIVSVFYSWVSALYLLAFLLLCLVISYPIKHQATRINIDMDSSIDNKLTVYWADEAEIYQEQHSVSIDTHKGLQHYSLAMANFNNVHTVRIEPIHAQGRVDITKIEMSEAGYLPIVLDAGNNFYAVDRVKKSKATSKELTERLGLEQDKLVYVATGDDAFFELVITPDAFKTRYRWRFYLQLIAMVVGVFICLYWANRHRGYFKSDAAVITLRVCLVLVTVMVVQMAWLSDYDAHPDEKAHIDSIDYYTHYWQPPVVGDQRSLNTYQYPWGVSRLDDLGVSYLLMGKLKNSITYFTEDTVFTCRVFNSVLMLLLLFCTRNKKFALFIIPLLCLPQVWHLFSYANRDGFALWLAILLGWQVANESSSLYQFLYSKRAAEQWRYLLLPAVLLGLLSIELSNYSIFSLFFVAMLIWQGLFLTTPRKQFALRCLVLIVAAGSIYGARKAVDVSINGFNKQEQKVAFAEAIASPVFKPSVAVTDEGYFGLRLQQKGVTALSLFTPRWEWQVLTFKSFAGLYGNEFAEYSPEWYYSYVKYLYGLVALILLGTVLRYGDLKAQMLTALTAIFVLGDLAMGFLYSWLYDFQPQGRYVFPLIPMMMVYLFRISSLWGRKTTALLLACALCLFVLAMYSFNTIALRYLTS